MVEMEVFGLALDEHSQSPILVLKDKEQKYVLPIWIGALEAMAISIAINNVSISRPMTHDLFIEMLKTFESKLLRVELVNVREGIYFARLVLFKEEKEFFLDSRPSDAIAIALRAGAPIMARKTLLEQIAGQKDDFQAEIKDKDAQKWTDVLASYSLDDLKYKM